METVHLLTGLVEIAIAILLFHHAAPAIRRIATWRAWMTWLLGLALTMVGLDVTTGLPRYTFGVIDLQAGVSLIAVMIGAFAVAEILRSAAAPLTQPRKPAAAGFSILKGQFGNLWRFKLPVLRGSTVSFQGRVSRELNQAQVTIDEVAKPMSVRNDNFSSPAHEVGGTSHFAFTWRDKHDLAGAAAWQLNVEAIDDIAPRPDLGTLGRDLAILETEVLELNATVRDDFGVKETGIEWRALGQAEESPPQIAAALTVRAKGTQETEFETSFHFSPAVLGIGKDTTVELAVWATDHLPGRKPSRTMPYRLHILGIEDHAEMVRQKLESILENLEEVSRAEEDIAEDTRELADSDSDTLAKRKTNEKIEQTAEDHGVEIPALKSIINPRLSEESPGIDRFFGRSAILFIASNPDWS